MDVSKVGDLMLKRIVLKIKHRSMVPLVFLGVLILITSWWTPMTVSTTPKPVIHLVKTGPTYSRAGDAITFTYLVNTTGSLPLSNVTVTDDHCGPVVYQSGDGDADGVLEKPETWVFSCSYVPSFNSSEPLTNTATVTGVWEDQVAVDNASFTLYPCVLRKQVLLYLGEVNISYADPGTSFPVQLSKDGALLATFMMNTSTPICLWLSPGAYLIHEYPIPTGYLSASQNISFTTGVDAPEVQLTNIITFDLGIVKTGLATCHQYDRITYHYTVTNSGPASVTPTLVDDLCGVPVYISGDSNANGFLDPTETWSYEATYNVTAEPGTVLTNTVHVTDAEGGGGPWVLGGDRDPANNNGSWSVQVLPQEHQNKTLYTLSVAVVGKGSVIVDPDQVTYENGSMVNLSALADAGWVFDHWAGDLFGNKTLMMLRMDGNKSVTAYFTMKKPKVKTYVLTVHIVGNGAVQRDPDQEIYANGTVVTLTAQADTGWMFDHWSGSLSGDLATGSLTMDANKTVWAYFVQQEPEKPIHHGSVNFFMNILPVADAGGPYTVSVGEDLLLNGSGSYDPDGFLIRYSWSFGDGTSGTGATVVHRYLRAGTFAVTLTVVDNLGASASNMTVTRVTVSNHPPSAPWIAGPSEGVKATPYTYVFGCTDPDNDDLTYRIDWGDGVTYQVGAFSSGASFVLQHRWESPGVYNITVTASDGQLSASSVKVVTIRDVVVVSNIAIIVMFLLLLVLILVYLVSRRKMKSD
jgi:hypothetical protein